MSATLAPLAVVVPVLVAAALVAAGKHVPRMVADASALLAALATAVLCAVLLGHVWHGQQVVWMSGWHPRQDVVVGIDLAVEPLGAGAATFAAVLVTASMLYAQRYFDAVTPLSHALVLIFLAGMVGFGLTGDLFNMFVFFELMSVPAYALTAYHVEEEGPIQGALSFAITNSIGGFLTLSGIALVYGRTGALNLAQIGESLAGHRPDGLVVAAFVLVVAGFLVKSAAVPFHFWLPDAHAVAPVPVCVLFSGIMVQLGLLGIARVYWTAFSGVPGFGGALADVLLVLGTVSALVGAVMCFLQHHLKRLLAFSTVSHTGLFLIGLACVDAHGVAGVALFVLAHGFVKGSLFMSLGIVGHRHGTVSERALHGVARGQYVVGPVMAIGGLALASLPPFGPFLGKALTEEAATAAGHWWVPIVFLVTSALTGGAVLRAAARVFLGLGTPAPPDRGRVDKEASDTEPETEGARGRTPAVLLAPTLALAAAGLAVSLVPDVKHAFDHAAGAFVDRAGYAANVLHGGPPPAPHEPPSPGPLASSYVWAVGSVLGALACAAGALFAPRRLRTHEGRLRPVAGLSDWLHDWHSGHVGDYATWAVVGIVLVGWAMGVLAT